MIPAELTVIAVGPRVRRHRAVTGEILPLLDAHAHVGTRVLLTGCTWAWRQAGVKEKKKRKKGTTGAKPSNSKDYFWT